MVRRQIRTNTTKVGGGMESVNGDHEKNKIIFCDSRIEAKSREF